VPTLDYTSAKLIQFSICFYLFICVAKSVDTYFCLILKIYPAQQEYFVCQLPDISGDICLVHGDINILSLAYIIFKKFDFDKKTPGVWTIFSWRLRG